MSQAIQELVEADRRCLDAAEFFLGSLPVHPSPSGLRRFEEALEQARATDPPLHTPFESLFRRHLTACWNLLETFVRYRFDRSRTPVEELLQALAGPDAREELETYLRDTDPERSWRYLTLRERYRADRVPSERAGPLLNETTTKLMEALRDWLPEQDLDFPELDAVVEVGATGRPSCFQPERQRVVLNPGDFMVFERRGRVSVNPVIALRSLFHELLGHGVQHVLSRDLPAPLRPEDRAAVRHATLPSAEGFGALATTLAVPFAEARGESFGLQADDLEYLRLMVEFTGLHHAPLALAQLLVVRSSQDRTFDPATHLERRLGHPGYSELLATTDAEPINRLLYQSSCFFGFERMKRLAGELSGGGMERSGIWTTLGRGAWALSCLSDAALELSVDPIREPGP